MRLTPQWSLYNRRLAAAAAPPPPVFDPATLFGAGEKGIVINLHTATMINGTFNPVVVGEGVERLYPQVYNYSTRWHSARLLRLPIPCCNNQVLYAGFRLTVLMTGCPQSPERVSTISTLVGPMQ